MGVNSNRRRPTNCADEKFAHDIGEGFYFPDFICEDTKKDLLFFSLVCRAWSVPARHILLRHIHIRSLRQFTALTLFLDSHPSACSLIRSANIKVLPESQDDVKKAERAWKTFRSCSNVTHAKFSGSAISILTSEPTPFPNLSEFHFKTFGSTLKQKTLFRFLRTLPSLRRLALRSISDSDLMDDLPFPQFSLDNLAIEEVKGTAHESQTFHWLLHSSTKSLRSLSLHWVSELGAPDLKSALEQCGASLHHLYVNGSSTEPLPLSPILALCPNLRSLKISLTSLEGLSEELSSCVRPLEHLHLTYMPYPGYFADISDIRDLIRLVRAHPALQGLQKLCLGGDTSISKKTLRLGYLAPLRTMCSQRNIVFSTLEDQHFAGKTDPIIFRF